MFLLQSQWAKINYFECRSELLYKITLQYNIPYQWIYLSMPYLDISLTTPSNALFSHNYTPFLYTCRQDLQQINKQHLSWAGRVAAFKIFTLPKLLYLYSHTDRHYRTFFKSIQQMLRSYIWSNKKPRCPYLLLSDSKRRHGAPRHKTII